MRLVRYLLIALMGVFAIAACSDTADDVEDIATTLPEAGDMAETATEIQTEMSDLATEIQNSEASEQVQTAWNDLQTDMNSAIDSMMNDETVDTAAIQESLDSFESNLEAAGDSVSDELMTAWNELRSSFEQLMG
jgi:polyhydroxyalkanoate synthesis regulator phasin